MAPSRANDTERRATGQILNRLLQHFRAELMTHHDPSLFPGLRVPHLQVFGNVGRRGIRLTELAERAQLSLAACSELVNDLDRLGYIERRPDPTDRRAKLIFPTARGGELLESSADAVSAVDDHWRSLIAANGFEKTMATLDDLLATLDERRRVQRAATAARPTAAEPTH
jgi:DNA-binding MarR family transcriptional regulator